MKSLLFIGFDFHKKTGSADFLLALLEERFLVTHCYVDLYEEDPYSMFADFQLTDFDVLVCWQAMPPREKVDAYFSYRHAVFFPMLDGCPSVKKTEKWYPYRDYQIISFSRTLARALGKAGFSAKYIQYFPEPAAEPEFGDVDSVFFWYRRERISVRLVEMLCSGLGLAHVHVHNAPDPGNKPIVLSEDGPIRYTCSTWFETREEMLQTIKSSAYYVAPRPTEGIGMSFMEAMAMGKCVIAPDNPTMNEYVEHGRTGLLYNLGIGKLKPLDDVDVREMQRNTHRFMCDGYRRWEQEKHLIVDWILEPVTTSGFRMTLYLVRRFFRNPVKVVRVLVRESSSGKDV